jgi:hypothetical protein
VAQQATHGNARDASNCTESSVSDGANPLRSRLAVVEMWWWNPFGLAALVFPGGPAVFGKGMVAAAG